MKLEDLKKNDNIIGHGRGFKITKGKQTKKKARLIFVKKKLPKHKIKKDEFIPKKLDGELTDIIEVGDVVKLSKLKKKTIDRKAKHRPSPCGVSIGHEDISAGTQGAIAYIEFDEEDEGWVECNCCGLLKWLVSVFTDGCKIMKRAPVYKKETSKVILSNNHVLADEWMEGKPEPWGDQILQPGPYDGGTEEDVIGALVDAVPLKQGDVNTVDAAIAIPISDDSVVSHILEIGGVSGTAGVNVGQILQKSGRTTGYATAKVIAEDATIWVSYDVGTLQFVGQIVTDCMSAGGDSGSLVLDEDNNAVGLLFAGSDKITLINPISDVIRALGITFKYPQE